MKTTLPNNQPVRRGIALMLVMVAILVTGSMAVAYFGSRDNSIAISSNVEAAARARAVAESGLDLAVAILETDSDWRVQHVDGVILDSFAFLGGKITLTIIDTVTDLPPTESTNKVEITILSSVGGITQTTKATATIFPDEEEFDVDYSEFALFSQSQLTIRDVASVQQWVASPLGTQQNPIQIGTLAASPMSVQINSWGQNSELELHTLSTSSSMVSSSMTSNRSFSVTGFAGCFCVVCLTCCLISVLASSAAVVCLLFSVAIGSTLFLLGKGSVVESSVFRDLVFADLVSKGLVSNGLVSGDLLDSTLKTVLSLPSVF